MMQDKKQFMINKAKAKQNEVKSPRVATINKSDQIFNQKIRFKLARIFRALDTNDKGEISA